MKEIPKPQAQPRQETTVRTLARPTRRRLTANPESTARVSGNPEIGTITSGDIFSRVIQGARQQEKPIGFDDPGNPNWRKATDSAYNGNCVELAWLEQDLRGLRDSKNPNGGVLTVSPKALKAFLKGIQKGKYSN